MRRTLVALLSLSLALLARPAFAENGGHLAEYTLSALGLPIGRLRIETVIEPDSYAVKGTMNARGLLAVFQPTTASATITGKRRGDSIETTRFALNYVSDDEKQRTEIGFDNGAVTRTVNEPEVKKSKDWVEIPRADFRNVLDPVSALLIPAVSPREVCNRTLRVFDGAMRLDIRLSYLRTIPFATKGYKGDAVTCRATFAPVAGYPKSKSEIGWLRDKGRLDVSFAPIEGTGVYAVVKAAMGTQVGRMQLYATRFGNQN